MNGWVGRVGLSIGILAGNGLILMSGEMSSTAMLALAALSLAGFAVFVIDPRNGQ
jgi:hypothetical protein